MANQKSKLNKYWVYYRAKAWNVTAMGKEYQKTDVELVQASTAVAARKKAKKAGWVITTVRRK